MHTRAAPGIPHPADALNIPSTAKDLLTQHEVIKDMQYGTVKWFNDAKGFGFISPEDGTADVFAHFSAISAKGFRSLQEGQRVSYELTQGPKGAQASDIAPAE